MNFASKIVLVLIFCVLETFSFSQNETAKWQFGQSFGLDFMQSPPALQLTNVTQNYNPTSSISDANGNLLFYTDCFNIYGSNHALMANGTLTNVCGGENPSFIIKQPGSPNIYYVFTLPAYYAGPIYYAIVDMSLAAGMGSVTIKNVILTQNSAIKMTAVTHCNGTDVWFLTHDYNSAVFRAFLLTANGLSTSPVSSGSSSYIGSTQIDSDACMKLSPNGKKLAIAMGGGNEFHLYDFDNSSGQIQNILQPLILGPLPNTYRAQYCEFSPDASKFYGNFYALNPAPICQWDLCAGSDSLVRASLVTLTNPQNMNMDFGTMQLALDGKIYIARNGNPTTQYNLSIIQNPNSAGQACNYSNTGLSIAPKASGWFLPMFTSSFFREKPSFSYSDICGTAFFSMNSNSLSCSYATNPINSITWNFGDANSTSNTSTLPNPSHNYALPGNYVVKLIASRNCNSDTITKVITISNTAPQITVSPSQSICSGENAVLTVSGASSYTWSNGATATTIVVSPVNTTIYSVSGAVSNQTCVSNEQILVTVNACVATEEVTRSKQAFMLYPNPFTNNVTVEVLENSKLTIETILGEEVLSKEVLKGKHTIDLSQMPVGAYVVKCYSDNLIRSLKIVRVSN